MASLWEDTCDIAPFPRLERDISTDVLIIGGGMAGLILAYMLKDAGIDAVVAEGSRVCSGMTKNTTAKITSQHGLIYTKLIREFGERRARLYLKANEAALEEYARISENIDCDFERKDAYVYSLFLQGKLKKEAEDVRELGFPAEFVESTTLPFKVAGAVKFPNQAQFDPLLFARGISKKLSIYEDTAVRELIGLTARTERGSIKAKRIVVATHFPFLNKHGAYFLKLYQHRSYVIALEGAEDVEGMYVDEAKKGLSFRNYRNLMLLGGGGHRTGKKGGDWAELREFARRYYPNAREKYRFAAQDCMTLDRAPYIGRYSANTEGLYVATGFNKWGMTSSMVAASLLTDMLKGRSNPYSEVFSPSRSMLRPQLIANGAEAVASLLTPTTRRCPHLGCALKWNAAEHTWDCPCHGSRFTKDGACITGPATGNIKK